VSSWTRVRKSRREKRVLVFRGAARGPELPPGLEATVLDLSECKTLAELPPDLHVTQLLLNGCTALETLPSALICGQIEARGAGLRSLPEGIEIESKLDLRDCVFLTHLPTGLRVPSLVLAGCTSLASLPEGLGIYFLDLAGCTAFEHWPVHGSMSLGRLTLRGCERVTYLPRWIRDISQLDVSGCTRLTELPDDLHVTGWIDVARTPLTRLPAASAGVEIRWRGVPVDERIAFRPETITVAEILAEANVERRRVLLERCGYERFLRETEAQLLDADSDRGGPRQLFRVAMPQDEDLACLSVVCPSTAKLYVLRVPPTMRTCRQAAAWIAGFDDPDRYLPAVET
jgi:hypothetical protein